jgi:hypothetical protein
LAANEPRCFELQWDYVPLWYKFPYLGARGWRLAISYAG